MSDDALANLGRTLGRQGDVVRGIVGDVHESMAHSAPNRAADAAESTAELIGKLVELTAATVALAEQSAADSKRVERFTRGMAITSLAVAGASLAVAIVALVVALATGTPAARASTSTPTPTATVATSTPTPTATPTPTPTTVPTGTPTATP